ncbi:MAG: CoB--CoM heterodisulfide reductase iron-sulfur subunit A family protein [Candidatus Lokiarchaeota archaeon]|nr:CoB--CoM heterodisulfide reductase iron-sulfur subunit A family protein [Candidatus Lokiarchaeota archaeon]
MEGSVLVIGGGIAGIQTSLDLTELGFKVYLVEREPSIGGRMAQFDKLFPNNDCSLCVLAPKMVSVYKNPDIELYTLSEVQEITGTLGDFNVSIKKEPRFIDETKCRGCGECAAKCPKIEAPNKFDMNLGKRKSVYIPFLQATPPVYLIDPKMCLYLNRGVCGVCSKVCKVEAIDFNQKPQEIQFKVGVIVVATGFDISDEDLPEKWGYKYKNVVTGLEYERFISPTGPFGRNILRPSDEKEPQKIVFINCVSSNNSKEDISYCSRVCCMYTVKNAILTKKYSENTQVSIFRHNIRVFGKNFYEYTKGSQENFGIEYFHTKIYKIEEEPDTKDLIIHYRDLKTEEDKTFRANMVVLAAPSTSSKGTNLLAEKLGIELDNYGFFKSKSYFNKSLSMKEGIFLCGFCQGPMNITETVADASGVAGHVATLLNSAKYSQVRASVKGHQSKDNIVTITPRALIIGGGVSGMGAALNISKQGYDTIIIEKEGQLGGNLKFINLLYPTKQDSLEFLDNIEDKIRKNSRIKVYLNSIIKDVKGSIGNYDIAFVDEANDVHEIRVGVIIVATGGQEFKPHGQFQYNEKNENVMTLLELEQKLKIEDQSWLRKIKHVTVILCVKSRQVNGFTYCSNVCCSNAIKNIEILKELKPNLNILVLFRDLHMAKKEFEEIFSQRKSLATYLRYDIDNIPEITKLNSDPEKYEITLFDDIDRNNILSLNTDLVILSTPMVPPAGIKSLSSILNIPLDENGFFIEAHTKLRPLDFAGHGIFVCGCALWPKNVQDSMLESNGAAGRASRFLSIKEISTSKLEFLSFLLSIECYFKDMKITTEKCNGCGICRDVCAFKAISLVDMKQQFEDVSMPVKKAIINPTLCRGCGKCSATCRLRAIEATHYDFKQISTIMDPYFLDKVKTEESISDKEEVIALN